VEIWQSSATAILFVVCYMVSERVCMLHCRDGVKKCCASCFACWCLLHWQCQHTPTQRVTVLTLTLCHWRQHWIITAAHQITRNLHFWLQVVQTRWGDIFLRCQIVTCWLDCTVKYKKHTNFFSPYLQEGLSNFNNFWYTYSWHNWPSSGHSVSNLTQHLLLHCLGKTKQAKY